MNQSFRQAHQRWFLVLLLTISSAVCMGRVPNAPTPAISNTWTVGIEPRLLPISERGDNSYTLGFAPALLDQIFKQRGIEARVVCLPWPELLEEFKKGKIDVLAAAALTPARLDYMAFSEPFIELSSAFILREGVNLSSPPSLLGLRVAVQQDARSHDYVKSRGWDQNLIMVHGLDEALRAVSEGRADLTIATRVIAFKRAQELKLSNLVFHPEPPGGFSLTLHFAVRAGDRVRLNILNEGLNEIVRNKSYHTIREQWLGPYEVRPQVFADLLPYLAPALVAALAAISAFFMQRRLFRRLRRSEERLSLVLEGSDEAMWDWDLKKNIITVNRRWTDLWQRNEDRKQLRLSDILSAVHENDRQQVARAASQLVDGEGLINVEFRILGNAERWLRWRGRVLARNKQGHALRAAGTLGDVTERKRTHDALKESKALLARSNEMLRQAQQTAHLGAWVYDVDAKRCEYSDEYLRIFDAGPGQLPDDPQRLLNIILPDGNPASQNALGQAIEKGEPFDIELPAVTCTGRRIHVRFIGVPDKVAGLVKRLYGTVQDNTERHLAEKARTEIQNRILETQRFESLGTLAGGVAHDFNNLLTVILSNASLARLEMENNPQVSSCLTQIELASIHASDLCKQMQAYAGHASFDMAEVSVPSLVADIRALLELTVGKHGKLRLDMSPSTGSIKADKTQVQQLILSLVQNAAEACSGSKGEVILCSSRVLIDADGANSFKPKFTPQPGEYVAVEVMDNGAGMDEETLKRIFEPFFSTKFTGRGLGLAAVHGIVRGHHGAISVESRPGSGSSFRVYLPALPTPRAQAESPVTPKQQSAPKEQIVVLVADDEETVRAIILQLLKREGCLCVETHNGREALERLEDAGDFISCALLDVNMPGLSGLEVLQRIRKLRPSMPIALMSGDADPPTGVPELDDPNVQRLSKPFSLASLASFMDWVRQRDGA